MGEIRKILVLEDHQFMIDAITEMLGKQPGNKYTLVVHSALTAEEGVEMALANDYYMIIMDYSFGGGMNGAEATVQVLKHKPAAKILCFSGYEESYIIREMKIAGAIGYLLKNVNYAEWFFCIDTILEGGEYYSPKIMSILENDDSDKDKSDWIINDKPVHITPREKEVIESAYNNLTNQEIANKFHIERTTIERHVSNVKKKIKAPTRGYLFRLTEPYLKRWKRE